MLKKSTYKAAGEVSSLLKDYFVQLVAARGEDRHGEISLPNEEEIETIIDVAFWASLRKEEGQATKISLAFLSPEQVGAPLLFGEHLPLTSHVLTKLAPGFERPGIHLGVCCKGGDLCIWGAIHTVPSFCFVLDISGPGLLVIKHRKMEGLGKFTNVAVLTGDEVKVVDEKSAMLPDCPSLLISWLGMARPTTEVASLNVLIQLAVSMRSHGRGGTMLIVPSHSDQWRKSLRQPINYAIDPVFEGLTSFLGDKEKLQEQKDRRSSLAREIDAIAGLTAIDGAIVINDRYELLAFGAKIIRAEGSDLVEQMIVTEPVIGNIGIVVSPAQNGGTRHSSAAQFVHDQRDAVALVASQDGRYTVFSWSPCKQMVQAHRIEVLLL